MINWRSKRFDGYFVAEFDLPDGLIDVGELASVKLPDEVLGQETGGIVFSGRGPVWLFAYLTHLAHPFAWVATHDPRLGGAVVVQRHHANAPPLGGVVALGNTGSGEIKFSNQRLADHQVVNEETPAKSNRVPKTMPGGQRLLAPDPTVQKIVLKPLVLQKPRFPLVFVVVSLLTITALSGVVNDTWSWFVTAPTILYWSLLIGSLVVFVSIAGVAFWQRRNKQTVFWWGLKVLLLTLAALIFGNAVYEGCVWFFGKTLVGLRIRYAIFIAVASLGLLLLKLFQNQLPQRSLNQRLISTNEPAREIRHFILPLTAPNHAPEILASGRLGFCTESGDLELSGDLISDIKLLEGIRPNWQQILRSLLPYQGQLKSIWLIGSSGRLDGKPIDELPLGRIKPDFANLNGSSAYIPLAVLLIRLYFPSCLIYCCYPEIEHPIDFSNYSRVDSAIQRIVESINQRFPDASERSIVIDTTGAQKVTSIVGATSTYRRLSTFQYVDTGNGNVYLYDVFIEPEPER